MSATATRIKELTDAGFVPAVATRIAAREVGVELPGSAFVDGLIDLDPVHRDLDARAGATPAVELDEPHAPTTPDGLEEFVSELDAWYAQHQPTDEELAEMAEDAKARGLFDAA